PDARPPDAAAARPVSHLLTPATAAWSGVARRSITARPASRSGDRPRLARRASAASGISVTNSGSVGTDGYYADGVLAFFDTARVRGPGSRRVAAMQITNSSGDDRRGRVVDQVTDLIGDTPLVRLDAAVAASARLWSADDDPTTGAGRRGGAGPRAGASVLGKLEYVNPGGSVKDRIAMTMVDAAEREGRLRPGGTIVEPTSGNTGVEIGRASCRERV